MSATNQTPDAVLRQIDAILMELHALRQTMQSLLQPEHAAQRGDDQPSAWDIIQAAPGNRQFHSAEEVAHYLREERAAWDG